MLKYVLITPARNEEEFIEKTLQAVVAQTIRPWRWVIVNDGSTDRTEDMVRGYAGKYDFIQLITVSGDTQRNFGSKSKAIQYAYTQLEGADFDYIGNLDADISFDSYYYENILKKMVENPRLGLAGGVRYDLVNGEFNLLESDRHSVGGPIQLFRRECFEQIGGYMVLPYGGIDAVAEISARMYGWQVYSFPEYGVYHYRQTGTANRSHLQALYRAGIRDYTIGYHPLFELARAFDRIGNYPLILGSMVMMSGYFGAMIRRVKRPVSPELVAFLHHEQLGRLKSKFTEKSDELKAPLNLMPKLW